MNKHSPKNTVRSVCPHDCPSTCALDVDLVDDHTIGRVRGAADDPYTAGVICEKVARYAERIHNPNRLLYPLKRKGKKGSGEFERISWDEALDEVASQFLKAEARFGAESVWPYFYAGTMGHVQRDGINRLTNAKGYSQFYGSICTALAWAGYVAGAGLVGGVDPLEIADAECVVIWGTNAVHTQVNVMTHTARAKKRGAKVVVIDIYDNATMATADLKLILRPGTDGALALAVMNVLLKEGMADREFLNAHTDFSAEIESHLERHTPEWAAKITGLSVKDIIAFAHLVGTHKASYFRLGYGFARQRNGATNMHAALCIPAMTGAWKHHGGGAFNSNSGTWGLDKTLIEGRDLIRNKVRELDQSQIGPVLMGDTQALKGGPKVAAMLIQNTNPASVAPDQSQVRKGFMRDDLFVCVHEQFMTETAELADIVLPATMFLEHNDFYTRGGQSRILVGPKVVDAPGEARSNLYVINELSRRLGVEMGRHFSMTDEQMVAETFSKSGFGEYEEIAKQGFVDRARPEPDAHFKNGFAWPDGKFRFKPNWRETAAKRGVELVIDPNEMPPFVDYWPINEQADAEHPFKLATSPARTFLNSTFNETPGSQKREGVPGLFMHPDDAQDMGLRDGQDIVIGNKRGEVALTLRIRNGMSRGVVIAEGLHANTAHRNGQGINTLISAVPAPPFGGPPFHDAAVWVRASN